MYASKSHYLRMSKHPIPDKNIQKALINDIKQTHKECCKQENYSYFPSDVPYNKSIPFSKSNTSNSNNYDYTNPMKLGHSLKQHYIKRNKYPKMQVSQQHTYCSGVYTQKEYIEKIKFKEILIDDNIELPLENGSVKYTDEQYCTYIYNNDETIYCNNLKKITDCGN